MKSPSRSSTHSWLVDGETSKAIWVGIEDPKTGRESTAIGYNNISTGGAGRWVADKYSGTAIGRQIDTSTRL